MTATDAPRGDAGTGQQTVNLNAETMQLVDRLRTVFERKLAAQDLPIKLSKAQAINMALKNELARQEPGTDARPPDG